MFCCDLGVPGDCSQGPTASGQCEKASQVLAAVLARFATVDAKTSVEESPFAVQKRLRLIHAENQESQLRRLNRYAAQ